MYVPGETMTPGETGTPEAPLPDAERPSTMPEMAPEVERYSEPSTSGMASALGAAEGGNSFAPLMIGDFLGTPIQIPIVGMVGPNAPVGGAATFSNPLLTRTFKVVEGQSPVPMDRVYLRYNIFNRVDNNDVQLSRYVIGFERTFFDGNASFGMLLPFYTVDQGLFVQPSGATPLGPLGFGEKPGSAGDLTAIFKYALMQNPTNGSVLSIGLTVTAPTGPRTLAGIRPVLDTGIKHYGTIQPWFGFLKNFDNSNWFIQNFNAIDQPFDSNDSTLLFNDLGFGYYWKRDPNSLITAIVPTFEAHATTPIGNRTFTVTSVPGTGVFFDDQLARQGNQLNLTTGFTALVRKKTAITVGFVSPVVGQQPFDWEFQLQLTYFPFGTGRLPGPRFVPF
jgi:hypothetical protein